MTMPEILILIGALSLLVSVVALTNAYHVYQRIERNFPGFNAKMRHGCKAARK